MDLVENYKNMYVIEISTDSYEGNRRYKEYFTTKEKVLDYIKFLSEHEYIDRIYREIDYKVNYEE